MRIHFNLSIHGFAVREVYTFPALAMFLSLFISEKEQRSMLMMAHDKHLWLRKNVGTVQQNTRLP